MWQAYLVIITVFLLLGPGLTIMAKEDWKALVEWWNNNGGM